MDQVPNKQDMENLVQAAGAVLLKRMPSEASAAASNHDQTVVLHEERPRHGSVRSRQQVTHLFHRWLSDSAGAFSVQSLHEYM